MKKQIIFTPVFPLGFGILATLIYMLIIAYGNTAHVARQIIVLVPNVVAAVSGFLFFWSIVQRIITREAWWSPDRIKQTGYVFACSLALALAQDFLYPLTFSQIIQGKTETYVWYCLSQALAGYLLWIIFQRGYWMSHDYVTINAYNWSGLLGILLAFLLPLSELLYRNNWLMLQIDWDLLMATVSAVILVAVVWVPVYLADH